MTLGSCLLCLVGACIFTRAWSEADTFAEWLVGCALGACLFAWGATP